MEMRTIVQPSATFRQAARLVRWIIAAAALAAFLFPLRTFAQSTLHWTTNYYTVKGATLAELHDSLQRTRPWKDRPPRHAATVWQIDWRFDVVRSAGLCRCSSFTTRTVITVTLPRWTPPTNASPETVSTWNRYFVALAKHEAGHADFALRAAREQHKRVSQLGAETDCEALKRRINDTALQVLAEFRGQEQEYDRRTDHGATEGAVLPGRGRGRRGGEEK